MRRTIPLFALAAAAIAAAAPAAAQYDKPQSRSGRVADEIVREVETVADAVVRATDAIDGVRYRGAERFAISRCAPRVERYGRMRIDSVAPYGRRSMRVHGTAGAGDGFGSRYGARAFTCTVRDDGRVKLRTRRLRA